MKDYSLFVIFLCLITIGAFATGYNVGYRVSESQNVVSISVHDKNTALVTYANGQKYLLDINTFKTREVEVK